MPDSLPIDLRSMPLVTWLFILDPVDLVANLDCDGPCWLRAVDDAVVFPSVPRLLEMRLYGIRCDPWKTTRVGYTTRWLCAFDHSTRIVFGMDPFLT